MNGRIDNIRRAEAESHSEMYSNQALFAPGSWLAKPVKTVLDLLPLFDGYAEFRALDLGCGVGRNSIPVARAFGEIPCRVDCVDILDLAVEKLRENARRYDVAEKIHGTVSAIEDYEIGQDRYDLILAVSALEHVVSRAAFVRKLEQIRGGTREGGVVCLIVNTAVRERDKATGAPLLPQFEVTLETGELEAMLEKAFPGWRIIKHTVVHQQYDIPREQGMATLEADVVTWVGRREKEAHNSVEAESLFRLAVKHIYGDGVPEDNVLALELLTRARAMGHVEAAYDLGICYHYGYGTAADLGKAYRFYLESAHGGFGKGMELVGRFYNRGIYVARDRAQAEYWLAKAIASGDPEAAEEARKELAWGSVGD